MLRTMENQYLETGHELMEKAHADQMREDRTKTGTYGVFGRQWRQSLLDGFPLLTSKKVFMKGITYELLWFLAGSTNNNDLLAHGVKIWDEWAVKDPVAIPLAERLALYAQDDTLPVLTNSQLQSSEEELTQLLDAAGIAKLRASGDLGPVYGKQWRSWTTPEMERVPLELKDRVKLMEKFYPSEPLTQSIRKNFDAALAMEEGDEKKERLNYLSTQLDLHGIETTRQRNVTIDQIAKVIAQIKAKPFSRRHIVSAWNPHDIADEGSSPQDNVRAGKMALSPCHCLFQFYVEEMTQHERLLWLLKQQGVYAANSKNVLPSAADGQKAHYDSLGVPTRKLSCQLYQRSADFCLGVPFNIASYAMFTMMVAQVCDMAPGDFVHTFGDLHLYSNHVEGLQTQLDRAIDLDGLAPMPWLKINPKIKDIDAFGYDDFELIGYNPREKIDFDIAV